MKDTFKQIFNFLCFFIISPIAAFCSFVMASSLDWKGLVCSILIWLWLILAYKYLIKLFD